MERLLGKLEDCFSFDEDEEIEVYLKGCFNGVLNFSKDDFSIIRVAMQEISDEPDKKLLMTHITDVILNKLEEFFVLQSEKGVIKDLNPKAIAVLCHGLIFHSLMLLQIYGDSQNIEPDHFADDFLKIIFDGIIA